MIGISKELGYVYFTSTGDVYARKEDAEKHQAEINYTKESRAIIERRLLVDSEKILKILNELKMELEKRNSKNLRTL